MKSNIEFDNSYLWDPTVFRPGFNENKEISSEEYTAL
jgi:hypothetical protein